MFRAQEVYSSFSVVAGVDEVECGVSAQHVIYLPITLAGWCGRRGPYCQGRTRERRRQRQLISCPARDPDAAAVVRLHMAGLRV